MKKLLLPALLILIAACSNPEDRATGNPDSKKFNSDEKKVFNAGNGPAGNGGNSQSNVERPDSSASPATSNENMKSETKGTNRSYGEGRDTSGH